MKYELNFMKLIMFRSKFCYFLNTAKGYSFRYTPSVPKRWSSLIFVPQVCLNL
jgi:hypothetical protein